MGAAKFDGVGVLMLLARTSRQGHETKDSTLISLVPAWYKDRESSFMTSVAKGKAFHCCRSYIRMDCNFAKYSRG